MGNILQSQKLTMKEQCMKRFGSIVWGIMLIGISFLLFFPVTNKVYLELVATHPYLLGFVKFAILATMGEFLAVRIMKGQWEKIIGFIPKAVVWGVIGMLITFMFKLFPYGIQAMIEHGLLYGGSGFGGQILFAFYTSLIANAIFGPVFMAAHRISDRYIEMKILIQDVSIKKVIEAIDWPDFFGFVVGKTIPYFWLPAHTITFLLPGDYRILFSAYLSIVLGILLAFAKKSKK